MTSQPKPETLRILFVDDNEDLRSLMSLLFQRRGYDVKTAESAASALELAPSWQPHLVVSDIGMPDTDGHQLLARLRSDSRLRPFRAIALSGFAHLIEDGAGEAMGFDACFEKPVDFDKLFAAVSRLESELSLEKVTTEDIALPDAAEPGLERRRIGY